MALGVVDEIAQIEPVRRRVREIPAVGQIRRHVNHVHVLGDFQQARRRSRSASSARSAQLILIRALVAAPASLIAPFTYSQIIWALLAGYFVFGDLPYRWMLLGCTVIVASGLFVFYREAVPGGDEPRLRSACGVCGGV